jgi:hypothetical protein
MMPAIYYGLIADQSNPINLTPYVLPIWAQFGVNFPSIIQRIISLASG